MANTSSYPVTDEFGLRLRPHMAKVLEDTYDAHKSRCILRTFDTMLSTIGEYEHGTADVDVIFDWTLPEDEQAYVDQRAMLLRWYASVCEDILMTLIYDSTS